MCSCIIVREAHAALDFQDLHSSAPDIETLAQTSWSDFEKHMPLVNMHSLWYSGTLYISTNKKYQTLSVRVFCCDKFDTLLFASVYSVLVSVCRAFQEIQWKDHKN